MPWNEIHQLNGVEKYNSLIVAAAKEYSLDPDLLRAIVYMETTHGYYDNAISNVFGAFNLTPNYIPESINKSILPMNINTQFWGDNFGSREQLRIPEYNIYAGAKHLKQLQNAVGGLDIEKIATLYNNLSARRINDYGKRVARLYQEKPWINPPSQYNYNEGAPLLNFLRALLISTYTLCPSLFAE